MRPMKIFDKNCTKNKYHNKTNIFSLFFSIFLNYMKRRRNELRSNNIPAVTASNRFKTIACNVTVTLHNHQWTFIRKCRNSLLRTKNRYRLYCNVFGRTLKYTDRKGSWNWKGWLRNGDCYRGYNARQDIWSDIWSRVQRDWALNCL